MARRGGRRDLDMHVPHGAPGPPAADRAQKKTPDWDDPGHKFRGTEYARRMRGHAQLARGKMGAVRVPASRGAWSNVAEATAPPSHAQRAPRGSGGGRDCGSELHRKAAAAADLEGISGCTRAPDGDGHHRNRQRAEDAKSGWVLQ